MTSAFTAEIERETRDLYDRVRQVIPDVEWSVHAPLISAINHLKRERKALILVHNYMTPEIFHGVADYSGDSLGLAQFGARTEKCFVAEPAGALGQSRCRMDESYSAVSRAIQDIQRFPHRLLDAAGDERYVRWRMGITQADQRNAYSSSLL